MLFGCNAWHFSITYMFLGSSYLFVGTYGTWYLGTYFFSCSLFPAFSFRLWTKCWLGRGSFYLAVVIHYNITSCTLQVAHKQMIKGIYIILYWTGARVPINTEWQVQISQKYAQCISITAVISSGVNFPINQAIL